MPRTGAAAAVNARVVPVTQYGIDPNGWSMFQALSRAQQRGMSGQAGRTYPQHSDDPNGSAFYGYAPAQQNFRGQARLGKARPIKGPSNELSDATAGEVSQDPALRILAQRLERRR